MAVSAGSADVVITVDHRQVDLLLARMTMALAPTSIYRFLEREMFLALQARIKNRFMSEGDEVTGSWMPLRDSTKEQRVASGFGEGPINIRTGQLRDFVTNSHSTHLEGFTVSLTMPGLLPGGELRDKFITAQTGRGYPQSKGKSQPHTVPRPVLALGLVDLEMALAMLGEHISSEVGTRLQFA